MQDKKQIGLTVLYVVIIVLIIWGFAYFNRAETPAINDSVTGLVSTSTVEDTIDTPLDLFAKCVASKGVTMYGAVWCSHCLAEKKAFGDAFKFVPYVECPDNIKLCTDKGINGYPTWIDASGKKYEGEQGLQGVAKISGCILSN